MVLLSLLSAVAFAQESKLEIKAPSWFGDLRYRSAVTREDIDDQRPVNQLRVRLGVQADVNENTLVRVRLATATSAISSNQTLGDSSEPGMPRRSFGIDLAYLEWKIDGQNKIWAGRTPNPFFASGKTQTIYDSDLAFEGLASRHEFLKNDNGNAFLNLGAFMIAENYAKPDDVVDTGLLGADLGYVLPTPAGDFTFHVATHVFVNIQDKDITSIEKGAKTDAFSFPLDRWRGNIVDVNDPLAVPADRKYYIRSKYELQEGGVQWKIPLSGHEILIFADAVVNPGAEELNRATETGIGWTWGRSTLTAAAVTKESDSVVGAFTDSDSNGGGTDNRGTRVGWVYQLSKGSQFALTHYEATRGMDAVSRTFFATQADIVVVF